MTASLHFLDIAVIEHDFVYAASQLDAIDPRVQAHARLLIFDGQSQQPWHFHDSDQNMVSVCCIGESPERFQLALSSEGAVEWFHNGGRGLTGVEQIPGAGLRVGHRGRMTHIRQIGEQLFACGFNGQVYQRFAANDWRPIDAGLFKTPLALPSDGSIEAFAQALLDKIGHDIHLNCIDGFHEHDLYAVGDQGCLAHYDGSQWDRIATGTDEHLQWVRCYGTDEVWVCGFNGALLKGNASRGFVQLARSDETWWCLAQHQGRIYLSSRNGIFALAANGIERVSTGLSPEPSESYRLDARDGALWSMGEKDMVRLHGGAWQRIDHPDNDKI